MRLSELVQYQNSPESISIDDALQSQTQKLLDAKEDLLLQLNVETATWGLELWENMVGITPSPVDTLESRRMMVMGKLRGRGVVTVEVLKNIAQSFLQSAVHVIEHPEEYAIELSFDAPDLSALPLSDMTAALNELIPAHLILSYMISMSAETVQFQSDSDHSFDLPAFCISELSYGCPMSPLSFDGKWYPTLDVGEYIGEIQKDHEQYPPSNIHEGTLFAILDFGAPVFPI